MSVIIFNLFRAFLTFLKLNKILTQYYINFYLHSIINIINKTANSCVFKLSELHLNSRQTGFGKPIVAKNIGINNNDKYWVY